MADKIDIRHINRKKLGDQLHYGAAVTIQKRLRDRGIRVHYRTIAYAWKPEHSLTPKIAEIIKEAVVYLEELHQKRQAKVSKDVIDTLTD